MRPVPAHAGTRLPAALRRAVCSGAGCPGRRGSRVADGFGARGCRR
ncbi:hypothetical protein KPSA1_07350 [Pseudomonas syringae pv. actinidiae]|uniref:Uncharacterized protein n=1 Tax=Pseudomonas syringae pv. actinidiae TaxID=103796 RepID=A0A2V0QL58_PSESF|nr:hypothetical protein KPSA1_07350 [Pseudomonas syringae pv. actinidiae]